MPVDSVMDVARAGLDYERLRLEAASRNIAAANVPVAPGKTAPQWRVDASAPGFETLVGAQAHLVQEDGGTRVVQDPGHPLADADGAVHYPATDMVGEMTTLMTASRGYEANVRAFNILRGMFLRALDIGAK